MKEICYINKNNIVAYIPILSNLSLAIFHIEYGINDYIYYSFIASDEIGIFYAKMHKSKIYYSNKKGEYIRNGNDRYYLKDFIKKGF